MINLDVSLDIESIRARLNEIDDRQCKFATAVALTWTAKDAQAEVKQEMRRVFDRPTPFTQNATAIKPATKAALVSEVFIKNESAKATPPIVWLAPQINGGGRQIKRLERLLTERGLLPSGMYAVPGVGAKLDSYGNMNRGQIQQILSATGAAFDSLQRATPRSRKRNALLNQIFALRERRGKLPPGIYLRNGRNVTPLLVFVHAPSYTARLAFEYTVAKVVNERFALNFERAAVMAENTATTAISQAA